MKIKIIDLLNKIANKEELPKEIIYDNWHWHLQLGTYMNHIVGKSLFGGYLIGYELLEKLNDEVEIIEEPKKIEKLNDKLGLFGDGNTQKIINELNYTRTIINELIDEINNLKEND